MRNRYYQAHIGRFTRRDFWEGSARQPLTLNKYIYANANPITFTDPSGLSSIDPARRGGAVNNMIGRYFIGWDPLNREYDHYGSGGNRLSILYVIQRALGAWRDPGVPGYNGLYPDLADFAESQLYEIKPTHLFSTGQAELSEYLDIINGVYEMPAFWTAGDQFIPPPVIVTELADIAFVYPAIDGVITYKLVDTSTLIGVLAYTYTIGLITQMIIAQTVELAGQVAVASLARI